MLGTTLSKAKGDPHTCKKGVVKFFFHRIYSCGVLNDKFQLALSEADCSFDINRKVEKVGEVRNRLLNLRAILINYSQYKQQDKVLD